MRTEVSRASRVESGTGLQACVSVSHIGKRTAATAERRKTSISSTWGLVRLHRVEGQRCNGPHYGLLASVGWWGVGNGIIRKQNRNSRDIQGKPLGGERT